MEKLLTVAVPSYNAEDYLAYNLSSLCSHSWERELEVLVIDDGSADRTGEIGEQYQALYPEIVRVIHKENGGHGSGINTGVEYARGKYFKVIDADDWVEKEAFLHLLERLRNCDDDAVISNYYWAIDNQSKNEETFQRKAEFKEPFSGVEYYKTYKFTDIIDRCYLKMHGITYRTSILKMLDLKIDEHCFYVDTEYILYPIPHVKTISFIPDFVYQYRIGREGQSVSPEKMQRLQGDYDRVLNSLFDFYKSLDTSVLYRTYIARGIARVVAGRVKILLSFPKAKEHKEELMRFDRELKQKYPEIYGANINKAVSLLRKSNYHLYGAAVAALKKEFHC